MTKKLFQSQAGKAKTGFWSLNLNSLTRFFFYLLLLFLPTQFGRHFWPQFSFIYGLRLDYLSPTIYLTDVLIFIIFCLYFKKLIIFLKSANKKNLLAYFSFLLVLIFGIVRSANPAAGWLGFIKFIEFSFLTMFVLENLKYLNKKYIFYCLSFSIVFESILSLAQYVNQGSIGGIFYYFGERMFNQQTPGIANASINGQLFLRPYATFSHPNVLAGFLLIYSLLTFLLFLKNRFSKIFLFLITFISSLALVITLSRVAILLWFINLLILFGLTVFKKYKKGMLNPNLIFIVLIALGFIFYFSANSQNNPYLQRFTLTKLSDESIIERETLINQSVLMFDKNPLLGVGLNNYFNNLSIKNSGRSPLLIQPVHNIFLLSLTETGILGFAFLIILFYKCLSMLRVHFGKEWAVKLLILSSVVFLGMFDHYFFTLQQGQILFSLVIGIILGYKKA